MYGKLLQGKVRESQESRKRFIGSHSEDIRQKGSDNTEKQSHHSSFEEKAGSDGREDT